MCLKTNNQFIFFILTGHNQKEFKMHAVLGMDGIVYTVVE
jgi:hypothetical protein